MLDGLSGAPDIVDNTDSSRDRTKTLGALAQAADGGGGNYGETDVAASPTYRKGKVKTYMTKYTGKGEVSTGAGVQLMPLLVTHRRLKNMGIAPLNNG